MDVLRRLCREKISYDKGIQEWPEAIPDIRRSRRSMVTIKASLKRAADEIDALTKVHSAEVAYLDEFTVWTQKPQFSAALREMSQSLRIMLEDAAFVEATIAANVHPAKRTKEEKRIIASHRLSMSSDEGSRFFRPKTPAVDHWFIGAAAGCLEQCEKANATQIRGKEKIIAKLFEIIGEPGRTEGSILKELQRQKIQGRPSLSVLFCPRKDRYGPDVEP